MSTAFRTRTEILEACRRIVNDLTAEAVDPAADLTMPDRVALAALAIVVEVATARAAGVPPTSADAIPWLAHQLAMIGAASR